MMPSDKLSPPATPVYARYEHTIQAGYLNLGLNLKTTRGDP